MAINETLSCPACNFASDEFFSECPQCGVVVGKYHEVQRKKQQNQEAEKAKKAQQKAFEEKIGSGIKVGAKGAGLGVIVGFCIFSVGLVICIIPVIGWIFGPLLMVSAFVAPFMFGAAGIKGGIDMAGSTILKGACPYCSGAINVTVLAKSRGNVVGVDCPICKKRFVVKGQTFSPV